MSTRRILVIDDENDIREIAKVSLQITKQWDVMTSASGQEGLAIASSYQPDAILLDVIMPEMDGLATLQRLKDNPATAQIPVILLTATLKLTTRNQYVQLGAKAVMFKPFDPGMLAKQIESALGWNVTC